MPSFQENFCEGMYKARTSLPDRQQVLKKQLTIHSSKRTIFPPQINTSSALFFTNHILQIVMYKVIWTLLFYF